MQVKSLRQDLANYLKRHGLIRKYEKQVKLFSANSHHPFLHTEILEPKSLKIYSFRIDKKYRTIFILINQNTAEVIDINDHYK